ncbi:MAG: NAD-dependent epimerase [Candidatus Riflebacteria bacterium]|nr:NAD-dependent epimerase [Candidatus Riflebacteria bacterium]
MKILVTGAAGFIGFSVSKRLAEQDIEVVGYDSINDYYDPRLKFDRLQVRNEFKNFTFVHADLCDNEKLNETFREYKFDRVINLAAQPGVRYSLQNPKAYVDSNVVGFLNVLEACRNHRIAHLVFASSSSVYGSNEQMPFSEHHNTDHPVSLYAATKKANELMAHAYSHLYNIPVTGLRFFTVYGPWGRPDMAPFLFTKAILEGQPIKVFNNGLLKRDFTYIDDIVEGVLRITETIPEPGSDYDKKNPDPAFSHAPYVIYNIGNNKPVELMRFIEILEEKTGKEAVKEMMPMQPGDVLATYADIDRLAKCADFRPDTPLEIGLERFVDWFKKYYDN